MQKKLVLRLGAVVAGTLIANASAATLNPRNGIPDCPALHNGQRLDLLPNFTPVNFVPNVDFKDPIFLSAARTAKNIASYFENARDYKSRQASYSGISILDGISIGQMQWNWKDGKGTLVHEFFKRIPSNLLNATSDKQLKSDLQVLATYSRTRSNRAAASRVIDRWRRFAGTINSPLAVWLNMPDAMKYQDKLVEQRLGSALKVAKTWMRDSGYPEEMFKTVLIPFVNFNIHAGLEPTPRGLRGVWVPQVREFKAALGNNRARIFRYVLDWMRSCRSPPMTKFRDAVGNPSGVRGNIEKWGQKNFIDGLTDEQVDLFAYAFLYATRSNTDNDGKATPGYSQLDLFQRGAVIILGAGTAVGEDWDPKRF